MSLLRLDKVSLNFGTHILLDEVDFQIAKGQRIGLLGRNGAGKTTLMRIVADLPSLMGVNAGFGPYGCCLAGAVPTGSRQ